MVPDRRLPRGPHRLAREDVLASQRGRMIDAIAAVVALRGYGAATVADVVEHAGVSRKTFYEHFRDKEDCFLAAYDTGVEVLMATMRAGEPIRAYLETLSAEPAFARTFLIEIGAAGPRAIARRQQVHESFAAMIGGDDFEALAVVGALNEIVTREVAAGRTADLPKLEALLTSVGERIRRSPLRAPAAKP